MTGCSWEEQTSASAAVGCWYEKISGTRRRTGQSYTKDGLERRIRADRRSIRAAEVTKNGNEEQDDRVLSMLLAKDTQTLPRRAWRLWILSNAPNDQLLRTSHLDQLVGLTFCGTKSRGMTYVHDIAPSERAVLRADKTTHHPSKTSSFHFRDWVSTLMRMHPLDVPIEPAAPGPYCTLRPRPKHPVHNNDNQFHSGAGARYRHSSHRQPWALKQSLLCHTPRSLLLLLLLLPRLPRPLR